MKLKFDSTLDYQQEAIAAVRDVFKGQTAKQSLFTVAAAPNEQISLGFGGESQREHFCALYSNVNYDAFVYDSENERKWL